jgi:SAM-dependent methyltransferase
MAEGGLLRTWWLRARGRLEPRPCPYSDAAVLESPLRSWFGGPRRILGAFGLGPGERVLEVGPGIGYYSLEAAARIGASGRLICLDVQGEMLRETRRRLRGAGGFVRASAVALPFASEAFDRVFLITVLGEIPDRAEALREIRRVLRPGGRLSISEQLPDPDYVRLAVLRRDLAATGFVEEASRRHRALAYTSTWSRPPPASRADYDVTPSRRAALP